MGSVLGLQNTIDKLQLPFSLQPLQLMDIEEAVVSGRFGFFYEVGCGKTVTATVVASQLANQHNIVCCPPIIIDQWEAWLRSVQQTSIGIFRGPRRTEALLDHRWVIMSHAVFRDSFNSIQKFFNSKSICLIVDEAQAIKNPQSLLFKRCRTLVTPGKDMLMLTATPTTKPEDTYTYMRIKTPDLYRSMGHWANLHVSQVDFYGNYKEYQNLELLADNFAMKTARRSKKEMFGDEGLDPILQPMPYKLDPKHLKLYNKLAEEQLLLLPDGQKIDATIQQRLRHALQQIVVNYGKFSGNPSDRSAALDLLDEVISQVDPMDRSKSKLVVWTYYKSTSSLITEYLTKIFGTEAVSAAYGDVDANKGVKRIMRDDNCRFLVAQPTSCGVGLELQHVCSEALFLEMSTVPMHTRQAVGRVDRKGQKVKPTVRFGQALGTCQIALFSDLLNNDDRVQIVERTPTSLRQEIFGIV